jgi:hypothetical protein
LKNLEKSSFKIMNIVMTEISITFRLIVRLLNTKEMGTKVIKINKRVLRLILDLLELYTQLLYNN